MAKKRKLVWKKEAAFEGWACSACKWLRPNPGLLDPKTPAQDVRDAFDGHVCAKRPGIQRPHKSQKDMNQAAARAAREALSKAVRN